MSTNTTNTDAPAGDNDVAPINNNEASNNNIGAQNDNSEVLNDSSIASNDSNEPPLYNNEAAAINNEAHISNDEALSNNDEAPLFDNEARINSDQAPVRDNEAPLSNEDPGYGEAPPSYEEATGGTYPPNAVPHPQALPPGYGLPPMPDGSPPRYLAPLENFSKFYNSSNSAPPYNNYSNSVMLPLPPINVRAGDNENDSEYVPIDDTTSESNEANDPDRRQQGDTSTAEYDITVNARNKPLTFSGEHWITLINSSKFLGWFAIYLPMISIVNLIKKTSMWQYFNGMWGGMILLGASFVAHHLYKLPTDQPKMKLYKLLTVLLNLSAIACPLMMGISAYGMYLDREVHIYGDTCGTLEEGWTCEENITLNNNTNQTTSHAYIIGFNMRQKIGCANLVLAYVLFVSTLMALNAKYKHASNKPSTYYVDELERGFVGKSLSLKYFPISFPFGSLVATLFKTTLWQCFHGIWGSIILIFTGYLAAKTHDLPRGEKKNQHYKLLRLSLYLCLLVCLVIISISTYGISHDEELHLYGVPCNETYIIYHHYTCEENYTINSITNETTTHAYIKGHLNYQQGINLGMLVLAIFHIFVILPALDAGKKFLLKYNLI